MLDNISKIFRLGIAHQLHFEMLEVMDGASCKETTGIRIITEAFLGNTTLAYS